ncbi:MAG TPA: DUF2779 domain-containing protein [Candidatus Hydrogenedentes bacterium]|nr:DUF2779 domain-containing protein [Candidatus Hydrogenedentota bacterium]
MYLTKSDFVLAETCPTKLYYKRLRYPSLEDDDPYLEFLADGGYMVETMAKLLFPEGHEMRCSSDPEADFAETKRALMTGDAALFQATVIHENLLAIVDILRKEGSTLRLIEVKSSSIDSEADGANPFRGKRGDISSGKRKYLVDVTFQAIVLRRAFPDFEVVPHLCMVDKARIATANVTFDKFHIIRGREDNRRARPEVSYSGDSVSVRSEHVLSIVDVSQEVAELESDVASCAEKLAVSLRTDPITRIAPSIGKHCKNCEFRLPTKGDGQNGFRECWGALGDVEPHILDLYQLGRLGGASRDLAAELANDGKASSLDVPREALTGSFGAQQRRQIEYSAQGRECVDPHLPEILLRHRYPLHFIDFETSRIAVPYHEGMHPYEQTAFQWSCHTIREAGGPLEHAEWLNTEEAFPNFEFAKALMRQIGNEGTVHVWSHHEKTALRDIRRQMEAYGHNYPGLAAWLDAVTEDNNGRLVDLCQLARDFYFHPMMKGSFSIKYVLPAVWHEDIALRESPDFLQYVTYDEDGRLLDPYASLPPLPIGEKEEVVNEGTGAMRVYQEMVFGLTKDDPNTCEKYRQLLLQYCQLDTAAMVMIWRHWTAAEAESENKGV